MKRKLILAFIDWYRPGYRAGGTITAFGNFVDFLEDHFEFYVVTRNSDYGSSITYDNIESNKWTEMGKTYCHYMSSSNVSIINIRRLIRDTPHDYLYINGIFSFHFSILPVLFSKGRNIIVNPHGMLSQQAFSIKSKKKRLFLWIVNVLRVYKNVTFHVSNIEEAHDVKKRIKRFKKVRIANQFPRKNTISHNSNREINSPKRFVSIGRIAPEKGTLHLINSLSNINHEMRLDLFGSVYDVKYWEKCLKSINSLPPNIKIVYNGIVENKEVPLVLRGYDFFVLLSEGENFGHAILEGLSAGCPVIISNQTPWKDLEKDSVGWNVNIKNPDEILEAFNKALEMTQKEYKIWSRAAFDYAKGVINDDDVLNQNLELLSIDS